MNLDPFFQVAEHELKRSTCGAKVAELARASQLFFSHFEHRYHMPLPDAWCPPGHEGLSARPHWSAGHLVEHKYSHFRYDNPIASYHPSHDEKWATHELCHALVGFAWQPNASPLFHSISARLSELLPVALWYFFDEIDIRRCPQHAAGGDLFGQSCAACQQAAKLGPLNAPRLDFKAEGKRFVEREMAAIAKTRRTGIPYGHRYATLDLNNDALTWTLANRARLESEEFAWFRTLFLGPEQAAFDNLDAMEYRVFEVMNGILDEGECRPLSGTKALWTAQDLAWRLMVVSMDCEGECQDRLRTLVQDLASEPSRKQVLSVAATYAEMTTEWYLPEPDDVLALGYDYGHEQARHREQISDGLEAILPNTTALLGDASEPVIDIFLNGDQLTRQPLARRFSDFLAREAPGLTAEMARYETAFVHPRTASVIHDALFESDVTATQKWRVAEETELMKFTFDLTKVIRNIEDSHDNEPIRPHSLALKRSADGELDILEMDAGALDVLQSIDSTGATLDTIALPAAIIETLCRLGFLVPIRYPLTK